MKELLKLSQGRGGRKASRLRRPGRLAAAAACLALASCSPEPPGGDAASAPGRAASPPAPPELRLVGVGDGSAPREGRISLGRTPPVLHVRAVVFRGVLELETSGPLDRPYALEFHPLLAGPATTAGAVPIRTAVVENGRARTLDTSEPVVAGEALHRLERRHDLLGQLVRVDLSAFTGRRVRLRWTVGDPARRLRAGLARLSLRPLEPAEALPSILLVCSDTHRFDYSVADEGPGLMPRLAALRERSVTYREAWSNASWTLPSIASALTGLYPRYHRTGLKVKTGPRQELTPGSVPPGFFAAPWSSVYHLVTSYPARLESLPEILGRRGYRTALVAANAYYFLSGLSWDGFSIAVEAPNQPATVVNQEVDRLLEALSDERPLFLVVHYTDVHDYAKPVFPRGFADRGPYAAGREKLRGPYRDAVRSFDHHLGDLIRRWDEAVGLDGSLVVFYSDHGEHLFDPGHPDLAAALESGDPELPESYRRLTVPVLNHGNSMQESLLRIPLVVKFPASAGVGGRSVEAPVSLVDLVPTVLEVAGVPGGTLARAPQGRSLLALARGEPAPERALFADFQLYGDALSSIRRGRHKLVLRLEDDSTELRETCVACRPDGDPGEPLDDERIRRELGAELRAHLEESARATAGLRSTHRVSQEEVLEQLRALGYAQ